MLYLILILSISGKANSSDYSKRFGQHFKNTTQELFKNRFLTNRETGLQTDSNLANNTGGLYPQTQQINHPGLPTAYAYPNNAPTNILNGQQINTNAYSPKTPYSANTSLLIAPENNIGSHMPPKAPMMGVNTVEKQIYHPENASAQIIKSSEIPSTAGLTFQPIPQTSSASNIQQENYTMADPTIPHTSPTPSIAAVNNPAINLQAAQYNPVQPLTPTTHISSDTSTNSPTSQIGMQTSNASKTNVAPQISSNANTSQTKPEIMPDQKQPACTNTVNDAPSPKKI